MLLENFRPRSKPATRTTLVDLPKFPAIDAHNPPGQFFGNAFEIAAIAEVCTDLDKAGITHCIELDDGPDADGYHLTYSFLEVDDEYFYYSPGEIPGQSRWVAYGIFLPDDVLEKSFGATRNDSK